MMLLLKVMRCDVPLRHSSGVVPVKRGPEAERFSSVRPGERAVIDDDVVAPRLVEIASKSRPLYFGTPASPGRTRMCCTITSCVTMSMPPRMNVMPGDGAVWPAMVRKGSRIDACAAEVDHAADLEHDDARARRVHRRTE